MNNFLNFLKAIISSSNDTSSKRLFALWTMVLITGIVTFALYKNEVENSILNMLYALLGLVVSLAGVSTYESATKHISNNNTKNNTKE